MPRRTAEQVFARVRDVEIRTRRFVESVLSSQYKSRFRGQGMQFSEFREYYFGDDIRHIDWKVTARTQNTHIRKFDEERELYVYFLVDMSLSREFGSKGLTKADLLSEVGALLCFAAAKNNDKVGAVLFSDQIEKHVPPAKGRAQAMRLVRDFFGFVPKSPRTSLTTALEYFAGLKHPKGVVFVLSDFYDVRFTDALKRLNRRHEVICVCARDPNENKPWPFERMAIEDSEYQTAFELQQAFYSNSSEKPLNSATVVENIKAAGCDYIELNTDEDYLPKLIGFFAQRGMQAQVRGSAAVSGVGRDSV